MVAVLVLMEVLLAHQEQPILEAVVAEAGLMLVATVEVVAQE
jgi:hypothetical protein